MQLNLISVLQKQMQLRLVQQRTMLIVLQRRHVMTILHVTSRLIVHPASLKLKQAAVTEMIAALREASAPHSRTA